MKRPKFLLTLEGEDLKAVEYSISQNGFFESFGDRPGADYRGISMAPVKGGGVCSYYNVEVATTPAKLNKLVEQLNAWTEALAETRQARELEEHYNPSNSR